MITTNAIQRTFHIKVSGSTGTCFTIDVNNKQYLVTAKHIVAKQSKLYTAIDAIVANLEGAK